MDILLVHTPEYVQKLKTGTLSSREKRWSWKFRSPPELVEVLLAGGGRIDSGGAAMS